ncbi:MAG: zinc ABC transporter substrate-binding protein [Crenarchaeota archaeon]|nr:zinc ABC transporter substrate-binding protein [Thermoproteota archaeon]MDA1125202.1 zinc ABC transporter substrate-binding protein [Thermoproteota archaeon]
MNNQIKLAIIAIAIVIPLTAFAVIQTNPNSEIFTTENSKLQIITTTDSLLEFTQNVGGDKIDVTLLVSSGADPHDWEPTIRDTERMQKSDMVIINGLGLEHWIGSLDTTVFSGIIVDTSNGVPTLDAKKYDKEKHDDDAKEDVHDEDTNDPHIWLNPVLAQMQVKNIANALSNSDPTNKNYYQSNAAIYNQELDSLDSKIRTDLSGCGTDFITFHNAFTYFANEYGLTEHVIINSLDAHGDVTPQKLENIVSLAKELNIKVIFAEESTSTKTSQVIADEVGGKVLVLSPLEIISDETYIEKMTQNLESLKGALC